MVPRASVVIPSYNRQALIAETIASALDQGPEFEVIVVDDGSPDDSWSVIESFGEKIHAIRQENRGLSAARNTGLGVARGGFVRFLDCDDRMPPASVRAQLEQARLLPPLHIAVGDAVSIDEQGRRIPCFGYGYSGHAPPGLLARSTVLRYIMNAWLPLFPAAALRQLGGFDTNVVLLEDHDVAARLLRAGFQFVRVPVEVCEVREHGGDRMSRNFGASHYRTLYLMFSRLWQGFESDRGFVLDREERGAFGQLIWNAARDSARAGFYPEARSLFDLAATIGGRNARMGKLPVQLLYQILPPLFAERLSMAVKKIAGGTR